MIRICRTCRKIIEPNALFYDLDGESNSTREQITSQLESIVPQMTMNIIQNAVICNDCVIAVDIAYNFKMKCIETEEKIYDYIMQADLLSDSIDISLVINKDIKEELNYKDELIEDINFTIEGNEEFLPADTDPLENLSTNIKNDIEYEDVDAIEMEEAGSTRYDLSEASDVVDRHCSLTIPNEDSTEQFYLYKEKRDFSDSTYYMQHILPCENALVETDKEKLDAHNNESLRERESQLMRPCSVVLTYIADMIRESLKQSAILLNGNQQQQNYDVATCSPCSNDIQTSQIDDANKITSRHNSLSSNWDLRDRKSNDKISRKCINCECSLDIKSHKKCKNTILANGNSCVPKKTRKRKAYCGKSETKTELISSLREPKNIHKGKDHRKKSKTASELENISCELTKQRSKKQRFSCKVCKYSTKRKSDLTSHANKHHRDGKFFKCDQCNYKNTRMRLLFSHAIVHTNDRPFKCKYCEYKSIVKCNVQRHVLIHTGEKPYQCEICHFSSAWKQSLQLHVKTLHD